MLGNRKYEEILDRLAHLAVEISQMRADLNTLMYHEAVGIPETPEMAADPTAEKLNKMFADGLDELLSFDGRKRDRGGKDDGE